MAFEVEFFISLCVQLIAQTNSKVCCWCIEDISLNAEKASAINHTLKRHIATLAAEQEKINDQRARCKNGKAKRMRCADVAMLKCCMRHYDTRRQCP